MLAVNKKDFEVPTGNASREMLVECFVLKMHIITAYFLSGMFLSECMDSIEV